MSKWVKYIGLFIPLVGVISPLHILNAAALPLIGGFVYGYFADKRREILTSPIVALVPVAVVFFYYSAINFVRLTRYISMFSLFLFLWIAFWVLFFVLGAIVGYLLKGKR